ncbi:MAG: hypothetical protein GX458_22325 [Phyllobacteriaceae bacterium]|nr:hypothetical protein [Phyllobacteriaceae bacterium]
MNDTSTPLPSPTVPRWLPIVGLPALAGLVGVALWAWGRFGQGVFFDTIVGGIASCL